MSIAKETLAQKRRREKEELEIAEREPRDEEKLDLLMEMIIDLHLKFNHLKDI